MAGIDHNGGAGHGGVGGDITQEGAHTGLGVQHRVIHIHINDVGTARNLGCRYGKGLFVITGGDEAGKLAGAGDIGAFADIRKIHARVHAVGFQTADCQNLLLSRTESNSPRLHAGQGLGEGTDVRGGGAAAASGNVQQPLLGKRAHHGGHFLWRFVVASHLVGNAGVGIKDQRQVGKTRHFFHQRPHRSGTQGTVQSKSRQMRTMTDRMIKGFQCLSCKHTAAAVTDRSRNDDRKRTPKFLERADGRLGIEGVETGFQLDEVHTSFH